MKPYLAFLTVAVLIVSLCAGCTPVSPADDGDTYDGTRIVLSDTGITVDGAAISTDTKAAVYAANDIVYYEAGHDFTYGEGTAADEHTAEEAAAHTVVHIGKAGQYVISGTLSAGQIAVDLGDDAKDDPTAVVTLVLDGVDITCTVAPAVIFYNVYECGSDDADTATATVDTAKAGANVIVADGSQNNVNGSYVARIYKPDSVELTEDGTAVADAKKLHKYDAAFYSKRTMNVGGGSKGDGVLNITAENEGLDSELHLTVNGGVINIVSGNDGINTNEDNVSVTTINGGTLNIRVSGETGEGDGIDSNGWLVINGGTVFAQACATSGDAGIDSDCGIHLNGGRVFATGNMLDRISESKQTYAVFTFAASNGTGTYTLKTADGTALLSQTVQNKFTYLVVSAPDLKAGEYTLWNGDTKLQGSEGGGMGGGRPGGGTPPEGFTPPDGGTRPTRPDGFDPPDGGTMPTRPDGFTPPDGGTRPTRPEGFTPPEDGTMPTRPEGFIPNRNPQGGADSDTATDTFTIQNGGNYFTVA